MSTAAQVLAIARSQLGTAESPPYSNNVAYTRWAGMVGQPWCDMFVSWCFDQAGMRAIEGLHAYTPEHAGSFQRRGRWHPGHVGAQPGDVLFFNWGPPLNRISHIGFVEAVRSDGALITIEGNTNPTGGRDGGVVMRHVRASSIVGYGRPDYIGGSAGTSEEAELMAAMDDIRKEFANQDERLKAVIAKLLAEQKEAITDSERKTRRIITDLVTQIPGLDRSRLQQETRDYLVRLQD